MTFFDTTPRGRIIARFSNDINTLDYSLPMNIKNFIPTVLRHSSIWLATWYLSLHALMQRPFYTGRYYTTSIICVAGELVPQFAYLNAAAMLHRALLHHVLRLPSKFFDTNPTGRILSRFSKDVDVLDNVLPDQLIYIVFSIFEVT
ncbi:hypothetical protein AND_010104 [Anopheles darlingi]|uniref:ABC transmembrane type-1 domain-containing protein n=1 Tax=Anopheles darlingi TaxID=43151 RepID=W5J394_ANODA|nr:hypothetical protein AND_010104 [Anopheles darlingi]